MDQTGRRTHEMTLLDGRWPDGISGHHWINGPGKPLPFQRHSIFAPGLLQRLDLAPTADGRLLWHQRDSYAPDVRAALAHPEAFADPRALPLLGGPVLTGCNNSFFLLGERVFLTADFSRPWEIDPRSLALATVVGRVREWGGASRLAMLAPPVATTAHPYVDREEGVVYNYSSKQRPAGGTSLSRFEDQLFVTRWDGRGEVERWEVPGAGLTQYVHEIAGTKRFLLLLESSSFHIETGIAWLGLGKREPHLPVSHLYVVRKSDLTEENKVRGVPFRKVTIPVEAFHVLADYDDRDDEVDLWLAHGNGLDFLCANTTDDVHFRTGEPFQRWQLDRFIHADYSPLGRYRVHAGRGELLASHRIIDFERYWGAGVWSWDPRPKNPRHSPLFVSWLGFDPALVSRRLMELYGDRPHRILPPGRLPDRAYPAALTTVDWDSGAITSSYHYPAGTTTIANQHVPGPGDHPGWVGVYLVSPARKVEYWLFDATDLARGPVARIGSANLRPERTIHHTFTATAPPRAATYHVPLVDDLGEDWRHLPEPLRAVVAHALRIAEQPAAG